jgi:polyprenyl P-hydroxybenzoate/phenylacrylic acid decarboxylase-like protein
MIVTGKETGIRSLFYMMILLRNKSRLPFVSSIHNMKKIAVAITGASGSIYAKLLLEKLSALHEQIAELSIVLTDNAKEVWRTELRDETFHDFKARYFTTKDFSAPFASGSAKYDALLIAPCSMGTLGRIAAGISNDLISRAAGRNAERTQKTYPVGEGYAL